VSGGLAGVVALALLVLTAFSSSAEQASVTWHPAKPRNGDVAWIHVKNVTEAATVEGSVDGRPLTFFPYGGGHAALFGVDIDAKPGSYAWRVGVVEKSREPLTAWGTLRIQRRATAESKRLATAYRMITPDRFWRGKFTKPVGVAGEGTGFGARRVINGQPRSPHGGADYSAPRGTPVVAANSGRVALVADFFFPGRLVVVDHGLGLYTLYFHLDTIAVTEGQRLERGQPLGTVGATGRATGPHLHFGAQMRSARVDPATLLGLELLD